MSALVTPDPILSKAIPPSSVPTIPVKTVTAPNVTSALSPVMLNTDLPALGPRNEYAPITAASKELFGHPDFPAMVGLCPGWSVNLRNVGVTMGPSAWYEPLKVL